MSSSARGGSRQSLLAIGLVALDVVDDQLSHSVHVGLGGTSGNVAAILATLGWKCGVVGRISRDWAGVKVLSELESRGVDTTYAELPPAAATPVIVERIRGDAEGSPHHSFSFSCPTCGSRLPTYQPITLGAAASVIELNVAAPSVLFIDRVSPASVFLAREYKSRGTLIYFEPTSASDERNFSLLVGLADVIKYSADRIDEIDHDRHPSDAWLEIQTLGRGGLRYRSSMVTKSKAWRHVEAELVSELRDAAGAGDWMTAYILELLPSRATLSSKGWSHERLRRMLSGAQRVAAWSCRFVGALGGLRESSQEQIEAVFRAPATAARSIAPATDSSLADEGRILSALGCCQGERRGAKSASK